MSLTVVIASYNRPAGLPRAVRSALAQADVQRVIVVDDASTLALAMDGLADERLTLLKRSENGGVCAARNTGLAEVASDYVTFLDDDDYVLPDAFDALVTAIASREAIAVGAVQVESRGRIRKTRRPPSSEPGEIWGLDAHLVKKPGYSFACKQAAVYPTALIQGAGGFDERLRSRSQSDLFFRLCQRYPVIGVDRPSYVLNRDGSDHLVSDVDLRETSFAYLKEKHAELLKNEARRRYFERNHRQNLRTHRRWLRPWW